MATSRILRSAAVLAVIALAIVTWGRQGPDTAEAVFGDADGDFVIDLAEVITGSDPNDALSTPEDRGSDFVLGTRLCTDAFDNDGDGLTDGADPGCLDSDRDIVSDEMEGIVGSNPNDAASFPEDTRFDVVLENVGIGFIITCADGADNDGDGLIDGDDPNCEPMRNDGDAFDDRLEKLYGSDPADASSVPEHETPNPGSCSDGLDNDGDGLTDGADTACRPVDNDDFADATAITSLPYTDTLKISTATTEPGDPRPSCFYDVVPASVWYRYTAAADGVLVVDTAGTSFDSVVAVWTQRGSRLNEAACASPFFASVLLPTRAAFQVTAGVTYFIQVGGFVFPDTPADLTLTLQAGSPPANDNYSSPAVISALPFNDSQHTADATTQFGEPNPNCSYLGVSSTIWYRYDAGADQLLVAEATGTAFSSVLGVWTDSKFGLTQVACNAESPARLALQAEAGRTYFFQVGGLRFAGAPGNVSFSLEVGVPPANDDFADAAVISSLPFDAMIDPLTATNELGEPTPSCSFGNDVTSTVWYRYTPATSGYLVATARRGFDPFQTVLAVYGGSSLGDLTEVACTDPYAAAGTVAFQADAGQTYYFLIALRDYQFFGPIPLPAQGARAEAAGFVPPPPSGSGGQISFHVDNLDVPDCAPPSFTIDDPRGDAFGFFGPVPEDDPPLDILTVAGGADGDSYCLRITFDRSLPAGSFPPFAAPFSAQVEFDTDEDPETGYYSDLEYACPHGPELGVELGLYIPLPPAVLVPLYPFISFERPLPGVAGFPSEEQSFGFALMEGNTLQLILPLDALGGDDALRVAVLVSSPTGADCAPNGGAIVSPEPAPMGDANCDGRVNAVDASLILQLFAGLLEESLPCQYAADVNRNDGVGPIDATLILQYASGMLAALPASG